MRCRLFLAVAALTSMVVLAFSACSSASNATDWFFGDSLAVRVKEIRLSEEVRYLHEGKHYVIRPSNEDRTLAVALMEVRNREANLVYLSINKDTVRLRDEEFLDYRPINPLEERQEVAETGPGEDTMTPFIWGQVELPTTCGEGGEAGSPCELKGWMMFEVPREIKFYQLIWEATDVIYLRF